MHSLGGHFSISHTADRLLSVADGSSSSVKNRLTQMARYCGTSSDEILRMNDLRRDELVEGQVLRLPSHPDGIGGASDQNGSNASPLMKSFMPERQAQREIWRGIRGEKRIAL